MRIRYNAWLKGKSSASLDLSRAICVPAVIALATVAASGCGGFGGGSSSAANAPPPTSGAAPPAAISVSISPPGGSVLLGSTMQFSATVANATNSAVTWSVDGLAGGSVANGTISSAGTYAAPQILPASSETIAATSVNDPTKSASASITVLSDVAVSVSPASATIQAAGTQQFSATVSSAGRPSTLVTWFVNGIAGGNASVGTISANGLYTAPPAPPSALNVIVTAQSVADTSKSAAALASVPLPPSVSVTVSPSLATIGLGNTQLFSAQVTGAANSGVTWDVNGISNGNPSVGTLAAGPLPGSIIYAAPPSLFTGPVTLRATSVANPAVSGSAAITLTSSVAVSLAPSSATLAINHRLRFTATLAAAANSNVTWSVGGITGGNSTLGQICAAGSDPCTPAAGGALSVDYVAPAAVPIGNPVQVNIASQADPSKSASAAITLLPHIVVSVSPPSATVAAGSTAVFSASVLGTSDQGVIWNVSGATCGNPGVCGTINSAGQFTAPIAAPSPDAITIAATSEEDTSRIGMSSITVSTSPVISQILPASAVAGAAGGFLLRVLGGNFVAAGSGPGSQIAIGGALKATICTSAGDCSATLAAADLTAPGNLQVQIQNPDGSESPAVALVVVSEAAHPNPVSLTASSPSAGGVDISVVDPSTSGSTLPQPVVALAIQAIGTFSAATNSCSLGGAAIVLQRPASGTALIDVCAFSVSGLDPSSNYWIGGPATPDVTIAAIQGLGLGIIDLTLLVPATAKPGVRTLFAQNTNKDVAAASGALEVRE